jgi:hypothetical protein
MLAFQILGQYQPDTEPEPHQNIYPNPEPEQQQNYAVWILCHVKQISSAISEQKGSASELSELTLVCCTHLYYFWEACFLCITNSTRLRSRLL